MADSVAVGASPREVGRVRALLRRPLGVPMAVLVTVSALITLWAFSLPGGPSMSFFVMLMLAWLALGAYWVIRLIGAAFAGGLGSIRSQWIWWVAPAVLVVITASLLVTSAPLLVRFNMSQSSMERFAQEVIGSSRVPKPDRVGLFPVTRVQRFEGGMRFLVKGGGFLDPSGFAYSPDGRPPNLGGEDNYVHLEGPWYLWEESW